MTTTQPPQADAGRAAKPSPDAAVQKLLRQAVEGGLAYLRKL